MDSDQAIKEPVYRVIAGQDIMEVERIRAILQDKRCVGFVFSDGHRYDRENNPAGVSQNEEAGKAWLTGTEWCNVDYCNIVYMFRAGFSLYTIAEKIGRSPMEVCFKLAWMGLVDAAEAKRLEILVTFSAPASLRSLKREPAAA